MATNDDHYIPDKYNAHVDTRDFEIELEGLAGNLSGSALDTADLYPTIHQRVVDRLSAPLEEPSDDALVCRYLSTTKFLWFVRECGVHFGSARAFEDRTECALPGDYNVCVQSFFMERGVVPLAWDDYAERTRARWLISSWTEVAEHNDDHLLWHRYAGGPSGVGITLRYGDLRDSLRAQCVKDPNVSEFFSGRVSYGSPLRIPPFSKRRIFRNEKEVRFVCHSELLASIEPSIGSLKDKIGLRFSPDAPTFHVQSLRATWLKWGGQDRYQIAGS